MPKFRTTETPEQASAGFIGLLIIAGILAIIVALCVASGPVPGHPITTHVYVPGVPDD